jgi:CHAT domain-containing protein
MKPWQLLVHSDDDVVDYVDSALQRLPQPCEEFVALTAANLKEAERLLLQMDVADCRLVVLGARTPPDRFTSVGSSTREPTKEFIRKLKRSNPQLPLLVLTTNPDDPLTEFLGAFDETDWVPFETITGLEELVARADRMRRKEPVGRYGTLELDIVLDEGRGTSWRLERGGRQPFEDAGELYIDKDLLRQIIRKSRNLRGDDPDWGEQLSELSHDLERLLFQEARPNQNFWRVFTRHVDQTGPQRTRIRFTLNEETYPLLVEALAEQSVQPRYWMLHAPVFRRCNERAGTRYPLFRDEGNRERPVDCLVIEADPAPAVIDGRTFALLGKVHEEGADVCALLARDKPSDGIGVVERLQLGTIAGDASALREAVCRKLCERRWRLVHFAGHAAVANNVAGLVLSADRASIMPIEDLVERLPEVQFLYLSSCRSADSYFVLRAAERSVPAVLGFRWTVPDGAAADFAHAFYRELFDRTDSSYKYLEYAFRDARKAIYERNPADSTWASPVLVMQLKQAQLA